VGRKSGFEILDPSVTQEHSENFSDIRLVRNDQGESLEVGVLEEKVGNKSATTEAGRPIRCQRQPKMTSPFTALSPLSPTCNATKRHRLSPVFLHFPRSRSLDREVCTSRQHRTCVIGAADMAMPETKLRLGRHTNSWRNVSYLNQSIQSSQTICPDLSTGIPIWIHIHSIRFKGVAGSEAETATWGGGLGIC
jgi:hypothetical protein